MVEVRAAIVTGLAAGVSDRSAAEFFLAFVEGAEETDLSTLPTSQAFDLLFDDDPPA